MLKKSFRLRTSCRQFVTALLAGAVLLSTTAIAKNVALLVGVGKYQSDITALDGPEFDVQSMQKVLSEKWGFKSEDIHVLSTAENATLPTKKAILDKLRFIQNNTRKNDNIFFYFSGHGTSRYDADSRNALPIPHHSGAIIPYDAVLKASSKTIVDSLIVGRTDLRPILTDMDNSGKFVTVVFDSCFSGSAVRSVGVAKGCSSVVRGQYVDRVSGGKQLARFACRYAKAVLPPSDVMNMSPIAGLRPPAPPYPYKNVAFLSAASDSEKAMDISFRNLKDNPDLTYDQKPHGAFTNYLLSVLDGKMPADANGDKRISYRELQQALRQSLNRNGFAHNPQFLPESHSDNTRLASKSVFNTAQVSTTQEVKTSGLRVRTSGFNISGQGNDAFFRSIAGVASVKQSADIVVNRDAGNWVLLSESGDLLGVVNNSNDTGALKLRLQRLAQIHRLKQRADKKNPFSIRFNLTEETRGGTIKKGEKIAFHFSMTRPAWVVIVDFNSRGQVANLYPFLGSETSKLPAGKTLYLPSKNKENWIHISDPLGRDTVIAFAFNKRPFFLNQMIGKEYLDYNGIFSKLIATVEKNPATSAVAVLDLLTVEKLQEE